MTKLHTAAAVLLSAAILLGGCAEQTGCSDRISDQSNVSDTLSGSSSDNSFNISDTLSNDSSSDNSSSAQKPDIELTFTEEDLELQAILKDLTASATDVDSMFFKMSIINGTPDIKTHWDGYYIIPEDLRTEPGGLFTVPQNRDEMEELISRFFSKRAAEGYMSNIDKAVVTETSDPIDKFELDFENLYSTTFAEIDGRLYRDEMEWDMTFANLGIDCETAKVTYRSEKTIEFSYWGYDYKHKYDGGDKYAERNGAIVYEDGAWKLNYFYYNGFIPEMPNEYTEQDLELQEILKALEPGDDIRALFSVNSASADGEMYNFFLPGDHEPEGSSLQYIDVSGPQTSVKHPKSIAELEKMLLKYFTEEATANYMSGVCKGTMTDNGDETYNVTLDKDVFFPVYIEIDGKMFYRTCAGSGWGKIDNTSKVVERTDNTIIYNYVAAVPGGYYTCDGTLKYERGGWKFD